MGAFVIVILLLGATPVMAQQETCEASGGGEACSQEVSNSEDGDMHSHSFYQKVTRRSKFEMEGQTKKATGQRTVEVHTCDISHAGTHSSVYLRFTEAGERHELDSPSWFHDDLERGEWDTYEITGSGTDIEIENTGGDGWCVDQIKIDGADVLYDLPMWLDGPCQESSYDDIPCKTLATFTTQATTPVPTQLDQDLLTVLTFNTYLLRVRVIVDIDVRPNLDERQARIATWFNTLNDEAVPDIVVLQEIYSEEAQTMLRTLCNPIWTKNSNFWTGHSHDPYIRCTVTNSKFEYATRCVNPTSGVNPVKTGGVVVLVKKGLEIISTDDIPYDDCSGEECFTVLGFWAIKLLKGTQPYWFFGTHAIAYESPEFIEIRQKQFKQMRKYIEDHVTEADARLTIAGDMNIFTGPYTDEDGETHTPNETVPMLTNLGYQGNAAQGGIHVPTGFWLTLDSPMNSSADPDLNHVISAILAESRLGHQRFDWVITPGSGDRLATPTNMRYQIVPIKSDDCFVTEQSGYNQSTTTDDLSDHFGVFAEIRWTQTAPECQSVIDHRGAGETLPHETTC